MKRRPFATAVCAAGLLLPLIACGVEKSKSPLSPSVAGPIAGVEITAPRLLQPGDGTKVKATQQPITLMVENSSSNGVRPVTYSFEVAADPAFENKVYARSGVQPGDGHTTLTVGALDSGRQYSWRVRAEDGANASGYSTAGFEVLPKPQLDPPPQVSPLNNELTGSRRPALVVGASARNAAIGNLTYEFQIAGDPAFASLVAIGISVESGDRTAWVPGGDLNGSTTYFWRARAIDTDLTSGWSGTQSFLTSSAPSPSPGPAPGPAPGGPCNSGDPLKIVECERAKFGNMNDGQLVSFLAAVADSLNRNGIPGGRFGLLVKTSGSNCNGYSCDIICSGNGGGQRQWDVVAGNDAQTAMWHEVDGISVRVCEIR
jgi:hypothetical protein